MKEKNIKIILIITLLVALILGASLLYKHLAPSINSNQLATQPNTNQSSNSSNSSTNTTEPQKVPVPEITVFDIDGNPHKLTDFKGKPIIMNFWATWCGYCKMEMPTFQKMYEKYGDDINFLIINMTDNERETVEKASEYIKSEGFTFPVYYDKNMSVANTYRVMSLPMTILIDADGYHAAHAVGAMDEDTLQEGIDMLLDKAK